MGHPFPLPGRVDIRPKYCHIGLTKLAEIHHLAMNGSLKCAAILLPETGK